jgi:hypothetical protein
MVFLTFQNFRVFKTKFFTDKRQKYITQGQISEFHDCFYTIERNS